MKKNWITKVAVLMLALVMVTSCFVGGTFAKYVTRAEGTDTARVAKWGVLVSVEGNAFSTEYKAHDASYKAAFENPDDALSVVAINDDQVVAPGTSSDDIENSLIATVKGTPEVATRYILEGKEIKDVVLPADTYTDYTNYYYDDEVYGTGYNGSFTLVRDYSPIKWDLEISKGTTTKKLTELLYQNIPEANLAQAESYGLTENGCSIFDAIAIIQKVAGNDGYISIVNTALGKMVSGGRNFQLEADKEAGTFKLSYDFDPNKEMDFTFKLMWSWAYEVYDDEGNVVELVDQADTYLGNWAAVELGQTIDGFVVPAAPGSIWVGATLTATAVQID